MSSTAERGRKAVTDKPASWDFRPLLGVLRVLSRPAPGLKKRVQKSVIRAIYERMNAPKYLRDTTFMNYGYAPLPGDDVPPMGELSREEQDRRLSIQLYAKVAAPVDLVGKDILEVGCGPGGGSNFLHRTTAPRTATGIDLAARAASGAAARYRRPGLRFLAGDAERLPFRSGSFDVVLNIESSHCYPEFASFFAEVSRVLRPGGFLLFADLRSAPDVAVLRRELAATDMVVREEERITPNVVRALELDAERRRAVIQQTTPFGLRHFGRNFIGAEGSHIFEQFRRAELEYFRFVLQKP